MRKSNGENAIEYVRKPCKTPKRPTEDTPTSPRTRSRGRRTCEKKELECLKDRVPERGLAKKRKRCEKEKVPKRQKRLKSHEATQARHTYIYIYIHVCTCIYIYCNMYIYVMYITAYSVGHSSMHRCIHTLDHGANCAFARALGSPLPLSLPLPPSLAHTQTLP